MVDICEDGNEASGSIYGGYILVQLAFTHFFDQSNITQLLISRVCQCLNLLTCYFLVCLQLKIDLLQW